MKSMKRVVIVTSYCCQEDDYSIYEATEDKFKEIEECNNILQEQGDDLYDASQCILDKIFNGLVLLSEVYGKNYEDSENIDLVLYRQMC